MALLLVHVWESAIVAEVSFGNVHQVKQLTRGGFTRFPLMTKYIALLSR